MHNAHLHKTSPRDAMARDETYWAETETYCSETKTLVHIEAILRPKRLDRDHIPDTVYCLSVLNVVLQTCREVVFYFTVWVCT